MTNTTVLYVPQRIKVGFCERRDTFSNRLAYITYFDEKNVLRKETSWNNWRDHNIAAEEFDNIATAGFAIDKNVGGVEQSWGRNARKTYIRVYDPRGFDFEITVPNLLYILNHCHSIPNEGLKGEFVYAWDGKDLVLLPTTTSDYAEIQQYTQKIQTSDYVKPKDLKVGHIYKSKKNEELIYMGFFNYYDYSYERTGEVKQKYHFIPMHNYLRDKEDPARCYPYTYSDVKKKLLDDIGQVNELEFDLFMKGYEGNSCFSPIDKNKTQHVLFTYDSFENLWNTLNYTSLTVRSSTSKMEYHIRRLNNGMVKIEDVNLNSRTHYVKNTNGTDEFTLQEAFNYVQPYYDLIYLENGHFHKYDLFFYWEYCYTNKDIAKMLKINK